MCVSDDKNNKLNELRDAMLDYAKMDHNLKQFLTAIDHVKDQVHTFGPSFELIEIIKLTYKAVGIS